MAEEEKNTHDISVLRTLKIDAETYAARTQTSFLSSATQELKRRQMQKLVPQPEHHGLRALIISGAVLLLILILTGSYFILKKPTPEPTRQNAPPPALIASDLTVEIKLASLSRDQLVKDFTNALLSLLSEGSFKVINIIEEVNGGKIYMNLETFLDVVEFKLPERLKRNLTAYTLGIFRAQNVKHPLLIFKINSYTDSFAGMLEWEKNMPNELRPLFNNIPQFGESNETFSDMVIRNQDARVLNFEGRAVLAYAFFNKNLLLITDSGESLSKIVSRFILFPPR